MKPAGKQPPIGYVLKALDTALSAYTDDALRPHQLTRLHWQTLNAIQQANSAKLDHIFEVLGQFADNERLQTVMGELEARKWLRLADQAYTLTPAGEERLRLAGETQATVREQLTRSAERKLDSDRGCPAWELLNVAVVRKGNLGHLLSELGVRRAPRGVTGSRC